MARRRSARRGAVREEPCLLAAFRQHTGITAPLVLGLFLWSTLFPAIARANQGGPGDQVSSVEGDYDEVTSSALESHLASRFVLGSATSSNSAPQAPAGNPGTIASSLPQGGNGISAQAISLPSGAASAYGMGDSFSAQLTTGIATFNIPFEVPGARGAAQVNLSLVYASSSGLGLAGYGWNLAGPAFIARQVDRGVPTYDDRADWHPNQDRFVFGAQELVPICRVKSAACAGALPDEIIPAWAEGWQYFRARVEGAFLRFFWSPDHLTWRIQTKSGVQFELGQSLDGSGYQGAIERNPDRPAEIYRWHVVRQYDAQGAPDAMPPAPNNQVVYRYFQDGGIAYLSDVFHTPPAANPQDPDLGKYAHHISLRYESRADTTTTYRHGWKLEQRVRLVGVDVASKPFDSPVTASRELTRRYHLGYDPATHASLLTSVQLEGRCEEPMSEDANQSLPVTTCPRLPAVTLEYQRVDSTLPGLSDSNGLAFEPIATTLSEVEASPEHSVDQSHVGLFDVNSDGLPDVLVTRPALYDGHHAVLFNEGVRDGKLRFSEPREVPVEPAGAIDAGVLDLASTNVNVLDIDGDATADLVHMPRAKRTTVFTPKQTSGSESGWSFQGRSIATADEQDFRINFAQDAPRTAVMDVNGDGLVDVVFASATQYQTFFSLGRYPGGDGQFGHAEWTGPDTATISNDPVTSCTPWSAAAVRLGDPDVLVADLNGDQLPDIARVRSGQILYWPGRGNGTWGTGDRHDCPAGSFGQDRHIAMHSAPHFGAVQAGRLHLADVNADGLADLVEVRAEAVDIYLNDNGLGFTDRQVLDDVPFTANGKSPVRVVDINGSGSSDILWGVGHDYRYLDLTGGVRPYLVTKVHNGIGRTTELEYESSAQLMVDADEAGEPWTSVSPLSTPVIVRATIHDNLENAGLQKGEYTTEYTYRDPHFEGRQREFRGFRSADSIAIGDANSPTAITRSTHLLGQCQIAQNGFDTCAPEDRWKDNWREPLKGLPETTETFDENGIYLSTAVPEYELRQLYTGRDGRRVSVVYTVGQTNIAYDTAAFDSSESTLELPLLDVKLTGIDQTETRAVTERAATGSVHTRTSASFDDYGNRLQSTSHGCVTGCSFTDEQITSAAEYEIPEGDQSGWLWRGTHGFVTGSVHTEQRNQQRFEYDAQGNLIRSLATLSGTLPLDRFHESSATIATPPAEASGGISAPVDIETMRYEYDVFGNPLQHFAPLGRCRNVSFDAEYAELPVSDTVFGGPQGVGPNGCGTRAFTRDVAYDRGFRAVTTGTTVTGQPYLYEYDGFARPVSATLADPNVPGQLAPVRTSTYEYLLAGDPATVPYNIVIVRALDGADYSTADYHETYAYVDGLGRTILTLSEADPTAGDEGQYVVSGLTEYDAKGAPERAHLNWFWSGDPLAYPLGNSPSTGWSSAQYDAFGRQQYLYGLDGRLDLYTAFHALGADRWDAADIIPGRHESSYASLHVDGHGRQIQATERIHESGQLEERHVLTEYLPTGEPLRITQRRAGSPDTVRWLRYDTLGRLVLNAEPNTSTGFTPDFNQDPTTIQAWRYVLVADLTS